MRMVEARGLVGLEPDPLRGAVGEVLPLPDRHPGLDDLHQLRASGERLRAVRCGDRGDQREVADRQRPDPVLRGRFGRAMERVDGIVGRRTLSWGAWHGDWTPWNMAVAGDRVLLWDWERFEGGVPLGFDALHYVVQSWLGPAGVDPLTAVHRLLAQAERVVAPFGVAGGRDVAQLYLLEIGARYETDRQEAAGARLGALQDWLLPALEASLDAPASPRRAPE